MSFIIHTYIAESSTVTLEYPEPVMADIKDIVDTKSLGIVKVDMDRDDIYDWNTIVAKPNPDFVANEDLSGVPQSEVFIFDLPEDVMYVIDRGLC